MQEFDQMHEGIALSRGAARQLCALANFVLYVAALVLFAGDYLRRRRRRRLLHGCLGCVSAFLCVLGETVLKTF